MLWGWILMNFPGGRVVLLRFRREPSWIRRVFIIFCQFVLAGLYPFGEVASAFFCYEFKDAAVCEGVCIPVSYFE